jgi:hypothetical protein
MEAEQDLIVALHVSEHNCNSEDHDELQERAKAR